jgi:hypothetical protein
VIPARASSPEEQVRVFLQSPVVSEKVKEGLKKAQGLRWEWARTQREVGEQQRQLQAVADDQSRLRANLREVPQSSPLHRRYLDKLNQQEDDFEGRGGGKGSLLGRSRSVTAVSQPV